MGRSAGKKERRGPHSHLEALVQSAEHQDRQLAGVKPQPAFAWEQIEALRQSAGLVPDDEGFTITEYAARYGVGYCSAGEQLARLVKAGSLLKGYKHMTDPGGTRRRVACFRLPEPGGKKR